MNAEVDASQARLGGDRSRYTLERSLGRGGMGQVYLAWDRELGDYVALKLLLRVDAEGISRLKQEFRALAHLSHPNLVKLYDLASAHDSWYFTMEYVDGVDLLSYVRRGDRVGRELTRDGQAAPPHTRLIHAFHQLASGVCAIHQAGKLHRDLKPANVLVSAHRVVVLDFGLVEELGNRPRRHKDGRLWGTPEYMAPEFADAPGEPSDWYAFGTMLYEALTEELPFRDTGLTVLLEKQRMSARPPSSVSGQVPRALDELCVGLLERDPQVRPSGASVMATFEALLKSLGPSALPQAVAPSRFERSSEPVRVVGRERELTWLHERFERCLSEGTQVTEVRGLSGAGKSALVESFLSELERTPRAGQPPLVLRGRCYEREALPFKALDSVMDLLVAHLATLDDAALAALLPDDVELLAQLFPVLGRLDRVQALLLSRPPRTDPHTRQLAAQAAVTMLRRLAAQRPIVIWIDDLQWGDVDSVGLLRALLAMRAVPILFVLAYRSDEVDTSACLEQLLEPLADAEGDEVVLHDLAVHPLADADIETLIRERLSAESSLPPRQVAEIARQAHGSPFMALQLSALLAGRIQRGAELPATLSGDNLLSELNALLPEPAQNLLATLAVAGRPLPMPLVLRAAGVRDQGRAHVHTLHALNLVRTREVQGERMLEVYHDRVREGVLSMLPVATTRRLHRELLRALEETSRADPDFLHIHARGASDHAKAYRYAREAAERAMEALAFERAVTLYRECLSISGESSHQEGALWRLLGDALTSAGRGVEAADAYLRAAALAEPVDAVMLKRLAASHLMRSGRFDEGEALVREVLGAMDVHVPESDAALLTRVLLARARLGLRGLGTKLRGEHEISPAHLRRIDTFHALREETTALSPLRSALFQALQLRWALEAGEPKRVVAALCGAALSHAVMGTQRGAHKAEAMLARAEREGRPLELPVIDATLLGHRAVVHFMLGRFSEVLAPAVEAERMFRSLPGLNPEGWYFQTLSLLAVRAGALAALGEYAQLRAEVSSALREIRDTDNRGAILQLASIESIVDDIAGQPERAIPRLIEQREMLPEQRVGILHALHLIAMLVTSCATEQFELGLDYLRTRWPAYARSPAYRVASFRSVAHTARAQLLLNHHVRTGHGSLKGLIDRDLRVLASIAVPGNRSHQLRYEARVAYLRGRPDVARAKLRESAQGYEQASMLADVARNRYAEGMLIGGDEGRALAREAEHFLTARGLVHAHDQLVRYFPELHG